MLWPIHDFSGLKETATKPAPKVPEPKKLPKPKVMMKGSPRCGNFDIISHRFARIPRPFTAPHAPCDVLYLATVLVGW